MITKNQKIKFWLDGSIKDRKTALDLYKLKHYDWCLFLWHLSLEKIIKANIIDNNKEIIFIHNLIKLAQNTKVGLLDEELKLLATINSFNLNTRYDDYKYSFYKKCSSIFTRKWVIICRKIYLKFKNNL
ncbi:DNA-binding protein [Candidatus Shapirobacteria bacterium CG06_land_8_20_14_3_00_40_12]|uniref:DNA-binding protein n=2 Tax=Candidatus Shapironibacteriota TaxID=1752721 RepID=A0A2M7TTF0_9BACT|nr:MAG: DNA-binding protein [Candidatus Shapirobacteria bacterium CG06_land_8_20_14_3_00_40_12]PIZ59612.1 MAG: DNA-binding protein [Candidatus Shapirobacteria bacterium CG_4_10_14_0_2_um_filter_40_12]